MKTTIPCDVATRTCSGTVLAAALGRNGKDTFVVTLVDASGHSLAYGTTAQEIVPGVANTVKLTFDPVVDSLGLDWSPSSFTLGQVGSIDVSVTAYDRDGNTIVGPDPFLIEVPGSNPIAYRELAVTLSAADVPKDAPGGTRLSTTMLGAAQSTAIVLKYAGGSTLRATDLTAEFIYPVPLEAAHGVISYKPPPPAAPRELFIYNGITAIDAYSPHSGFATPQTTIPVTVPANESMLGLAVDDRDDVYYVTNQPLFQYMIANPATLYKCAPVRADPLTYSGCTSLGSIPGGSSLALDRAGNAFVAYEVACDACGGGFIGAIGTFPVAAGPATIRSVITNAPGQQGQGIFFGGVAVNATASAMATVNFGDPEYCTLSGTPPVAKCTSVENAVSAAFGPESNYQSPGKAVAMDDAGNAYFAGGGSFSAGSPVVVAIRCPAGVVASSAPCSADTIAVTSTFGGVPSLAFDSATASAALYGLASPGLISFPAGKPPGSVHAPGSAVWAGPIAITPDY